MAVGWSTGHWNPPGSPGPSIEPLVIIFIGNYEGTIFPELSTIHGMAEGDHPLRSTGSSRSSKRDRPRQSDGSGLAAVGVEGNHIVESTATAIHREGITFDTKTDIVADHGADNSGDSPIDDALMEAMADRTLITFPAGEYKIGQEVVSGNYSTLGFTGEGDVTLVPPQGFNNRLLNLYDVDEVLFEAIDIDLTAEDTTAGLRFDTNDGFVIQDVEYLGRGMHSDDTWTVNGFYLIVTNPEGNGLLRNVTAVKGSALGRFKAGNGRVGVWIGGDNQGTICIDNCQFEEFGNNACYTSKTPGNVHIIDSVFRNNNISSVRIGAKGSYVDNSVIDVDLSKYTGPVDGMDTDCNLRGIVVEQGSLDKPGGAEIRSCDLMVADVDNSQGAIVGWSTAKVIRILDTAIQVDAADVMAINAQHARVELDNVCITGAASGRKTIRFYRCHNSTVTDCCLHQSGADRDGIHLVESETNEITDSTINVTGEGIRETSDGTLGTETSNVSHTGHCSEPVPGSLTEVSGEYAQPTKGTTKWHIPLNDNFAAIETDVRLIAARLGMDPDVVGGYHTPERGATDWHIPLNENFEKIADDITRLAEEVCLHGPGSYLQPAKDSTNWHQPLNDNFSQIGADVKRIVNKLQ